MNKYKEIKLEPDKSYGFIPMTTRLGRAEFTTCLVYKYGKLRKLYFYPEQQEDVDYFYTYEFSSPPDSFQLSSWTHKYMDEPKIWLHLWCKEHKAYSFRAYVPPQAHSFTFSPMSTATINFDIKEQP